MQRMILGVSETGFDVTIDGDYENRIHLDSEDAFREFVEGIDQEDTLLMCSSSVDFPDESTDLQWVIDMCDKLKRCS